MQHRREIKFMKLKERKNNTYNIKNLPLIKYLVIIKKT